MANIGPNHQSNLFFSPVPKSPNQPYVSALCKKKLTLDLVKSCLGPFKIPASGDSFLSNRDVEKQIGFLCMFCGPR